MCPSPAGGASIPGYKPIMGGQQIFCHYRIDLASSAPSTSSTKPSYYTRSVPLLGERNLLGTWSFGQLKRTFVADVGKAYPRDVEAGNKKWRLTTRQGVHLPDADPLALHVLGGEHEDFFLVQVDDSADAGNEDLEGLSKSDLNYYYAHDQTQTRSEAQQRQAIDAPPVRMGHNKRQSPFGTDIEKYETLTSYSFSDYNSTTVKVFILLPGIGKIPPDQIKSNFGERSFEVLVHGYNKKNWRLGCAKTHALVIPDKCRHVIRDNKITLVLHKATAGDIWFDLFKKKAIGDEEKP
ncbi:unnamed protein product [Amoebophrya sp. A25]|nr:unnamed protein product [Amoebophrya sp. A25]|eukprot:GSA25T00020958001.1